MNPSPMIFSSGMSRRGDFLPALAANHSIGIDIGEMSSASIADLADAFAKSAAHLFIDSGAFAYHRAVKRAAKPPKPGKKPAKAPKPVNFAAVFNRFEELARAVCVADGGGDEAASRLHFVMPDVVGDPAASVALWREFEHELYPDAIIPLHGDDLVGMFDAACEIFGRNGGLRVGIPSAAMAASDAAFAELLNKRGHLIDSVHILGAASELRAAHRVNELASADYDGPVSFDANRVRSYWKHCSRKEGMARLLAGLPPLRSADVSGQLSLEGVM